MTVAAVAQRLGGIKVLKTPIRSELDLAVAVAKGLPTAAVDALVAHGAILTHEIGHLLLPPQTLADRKKRRRPLTPDESDRVAGIARLHARATEILGDDGKAFAWMRRPNRALGGQPPVELLRTGEGARLVDDVLTRLEHGVFA